MNRATYLNTVFARAQEMLPVHLFNHVHKGTVHGNNHTVTSTKSTEVGILWNRGQIVVN